MVHLPKQVSLHLSAKINKKFVFEGLEHLGELLGASYDDGLVVTTKTGAVAHCRGLPVEGRWPCQQVAEPLPTPLRAGCAAMLPGGTLRAAVSLEEDDGVLLLHAGLDGKWTPVGEVSLPHHSHHRFSFERRGAELYISSPHGALKWHIGTLQ
ncbi:unnamed protein product [Durusdinium trenchii]